MGSVASVDRQRQAWLLTDSGKKWLASKYTQKEINSELIDLEPSAARRAQEELDNTHGERVWFSRYIWNGHLMHWAVICHNTKYEFRRMMRDDVPLDEFICRVTSCTIEQEHNQAFMTQLALPTLDGWYICLIGWTKKTKADIDATWSVYNSYNMRWRDCQEFQGLFAKQILVEKTRDYRFFKDSIKVWYTKESMLGQPSAKLMLAMARRGPWIQLDHKPTCARDFQEMYAQTPGQKHLLSLVEGKMIQIAVDEHFRSKKR